MLLAIDPGPADSAYVLMDDIGHVRECDHVDNDRMLELLDGFSCHVAIERIECFGMPVGAETFETCYFIGRCIERIGPERVTLVSRREVKLHLCGNSRAKDPNVRQAIIDLYGGKAAKGCKATPGPLYGVSKHGWQALGVALTYRASVPDERVA